MELSVVITHHRELNLLKKCLFLIREETKSIESEIIVILSEYQKETLRALKKEFDNVIFLPFKENLYFVRSVNRGLEKTKGDYILLINDDVMVSPGSIKPLIDYLKTNEEVGLIGPRVRYPDGRSQPSCFRFYTPLTIICRRTILGKIGFCKKINDNFLYKDRDIYREGGMNVDWLMNGSGVITRKINLEKVGLLDERFRHYFSDVDWCRRFWQNGLKVVYFPKVVFYHYHGKKSQGRGLLSLLTNRMTRVHLWDGIKYFWKWGVRRPE
jgi:hypothetical protein